MEIDPIVLLEFIVFLNVGTICLMVPAFYILLIFDDSLIKGKKKRIVAGYLMIAAWLVSVVMMDLTYMNKI